MGQLNLIDLLVFILYFVVSDDVWMDGISTKQAPSKTAAISFSLKARLTWWAIGASLIASNISAEQFIGMSGQGFFVGLAVAAYEWVAAIALVIVAVFFMPIYLKYHIYTMPQFLKMRYNDTVAMIMADFLAISLRFRQPDLDPVSRCYRHQHSCGS